jgi:hypothetical protein
MTNKEIAREDIQAARDNTQREVEALERFFSVTSIDAWPFVVALCNSDGEPSSALQVLKKHDDGTVSYNFAAHGRSASQYSRADAHRIAKDLQVDKTFTVKAMGKRDFFAIMLERNRRVVETFDELLAEADA